MKNSAMDFIDLEKPYERVPRVACIACIIHGVTKTTGILTVYVEIIQYTFDEMRINIKSMCGEIEDFTKLKVKVNISGNDIESGLLSWILWTSLRTVYMM